MQELEEKTYAFTTFRISLLQYQIEQWYQQQRITEQQALETLTALETAQQQFNQAPTIHLKKAALEQAANAWTIARQGGRP